MQNKFIKHIKILSIMLCIFGLPAKAEEINFNQLKDIKIQNLQELVKNGYSIPKDALTYVLGETGQELSMYPSKCNFFPISGSDKYYFGSQSIHIVNSDIFDEENTTSLGSLEIQNTYHEKIPSYDKDKNFVELVEFLIQHGAEVNPKLGGEKGYPQITPLMAAAYAGNYPLIELLITQGAEVLAHDGFGNTALSYTFLGYSDCVDIPIFKIIQILIQAGDDFKNFTYRE